MYQYGWRYIKLAQNEARNIDRQFRHVSIITNHRGNIIAIGSNKYKTHPLTKALGYRGVVVHSELHAFTKLSYTDKQLRLYLFNYRFNNNLEMRLSRPCKNCLPWCIEIFEDIYYTTSEGMVCKV